MYSKEVSKVKVALVNGSLHKSGCTDRALREVAKSLQEEGIETELFWIGTKALSGCTACKACVKIGRCVFDDAVNEFREIAKKCHGFIFGSPVHYAGMSAAMTAFMDRLFYSDLSGNANRTFYMKPAACVLSARRAGTTAAFDQMNKYFTIQEMPVVSSRYWNMVHGAAPEEVEQDAEGLYTMRVLGRNMAFLLKCRKVGQENGVALPKKEAAVFTNFVR